MYIYKQEYKGNGNKKQTKAMARSFIDTLEESNTIRPRRVYLGCRTPQLSGPNCISKKYITEYPRRVTAAEWHWTDSHDTPPGSHSASTQ